MHVIYYIHIYSRLHIFAVLVIIIIVKTDLIVAFYYLYIYNIIYINLLLITAVRFAMIINIYIHGCNYQSFQILVVVYSCGGPEGRDSPNVLRDNPNVLCDNPDILCDNATMPRYPTFYVTIPTFYPKVSNIHVTIPTFYMKVSSVLCDNVLARPVLIRATPQKLHINFHYPQLVTVGALCLWLCRTIPR